MTTAIESFAIGGLRLDSLVVLAPMAGITNLPFRVLVKSAGCGLVCSEMVSSNGLVQGAAKTLRYLDTLPEERPVSVQIFGTDPDIMGRAAKIVESRGADILDINFGCSVRKVIKTGAGVALMRTPEKAEAVLNAVRQSVSIPMTLKMRTGWDASGQQALQLAEIAQGCGLDAVAVHPRTASQKFMGTADWSVISAVKRGVDIPVIGNGDIRKPQDALRMLEETGCDAVMVGRAAVGRPWLFSQIVQYMIHREFEAVEPAERLKYALRYLRLSVDYLGEAFACPMMRSRLGWFVKALPHSSRFRESIKQISSLAEAEEKLYAYFDQLDKMGQGRFNTMHTPAVHPEKASSRSNRSVD